MPQAIPILVSVGAKIAGLTALQGALLAVGASLVVANYQTNKAKREARAQYNAAQVDRIANVPNTTQPRSLVLGRARVGGHIAFRGSVGTNKEKFVMVLAIAAHQIDAVEELWLNDVKVTVDENGYVQTQPYLTRRKETGWVPVDQLSTIDPIPGTSIPFGATFEGDPVGYSYQYYVYESKARIRAYLGAPDQAADAQVLADFPALWSANHRLAGVAYLVCEYWYDETAFPSGLPVVSATIRGARCYDPRDGQTRWTENPAIHMRHILTHPQFGKRSGLLPEEDARIASAANACDQLYEYINGQPVPVYRSALVVPFGTTPKEALDDLAQAMAGQWAFASGQFFCRAGVYSAPVMSLTEADLAVVVRDSGGGVTQQPIGISVHAARVDKFNTVLARIWDGGQAYKMVPQEPLKATELILADGQEITQEVPMPAVAHGSQARYIAGVMLRDARDPLVFTAQFKMTAYPLEIFDSVTVTIPRYGWVDKEFMVLSRRWSSEGTIELTFKETSAATYNRWMPFTATGYAENTALPKPWDIDPPAGLAANSGTSELIRSSDGTIVTRVRVHWDPVTDQSVLDSGRVEVQWSLVGPNVSWYSTTALGSDTSLYLTNVPDGVTIVIRARTYNQVATSDWCNQIPHFVVGKTEPPPPFDVFTVFAQPDGTRQYNFAYTTTERPLDWLGAEIRYTPGTVGSPVWENMSQLQDASTHYTASPVEANAPLAGEWTFACRSLDTSGNLSTMKVLSVTLNSRRTGDVYDEFNEGLEGWLGTLTGFTKLSDGTLEVLGSGTWSTPATWASFSTWSTPAGTPGVYVTPGRDLGTVLAGQVDATYAASGAVTLELSTSTDGITWGAWVTPDGPFTSRWVRMRITVSGAAPALSSFTWNVNAEVKREYLNDIVPSALTGSFRISVGDIRVPVNNTYTVIKRIGVTIQDGSAGSWTWQRIDNTPTPGPRVQFKLNGVLTDPAFVDFDVEGI